MRSRSLWPAGKPDARSPFLSGFVVEGEQLYLLPVKGSDTQWYRNILQNPTMQIGVLGEQAEFRAVPITDAELIQSVVEKFRKKYGAGDVKKYYSKFDVAVRAQ